MQSPHTHGRSSRRSIHAAIGATISLTAAVSLATPPSTQHPGIAPALDRDLWRALQQGDPGAITNLAPPPPPPPPFRNFDGLGNNVQHPVWGSAGWRYRRDPSGSRYADGINAPAGTTRPSARLISNTIAAQGDIEIADERGLSTAIYEFGQFLDHDLGLAKGGSTEDFDIAVPTGDPYFDPSSTGTQAIFLDRSAFDPATGISTPRQQINSVTSYIDASHIYGSDATRAAWLRTFSGGRMKVDTTPLGDFLPLNDGTQANDNPVGAPATSLRVAGDVRANEQPGLTTLHTVFLREHNHQADRLAGLHPDWNDERIYQEARKIIGAEMEVITCEEFLPALLGHPLPPYAGYRPDVDASLSNTFATAAYRFGHSQVGPDVGVVDTSFNEIDSLDLASVFFNPQVIPSVGGIDPLLRYFAISPAQALDTLIVDQLRNFLFGPPGAGGFDLASLNIQRGRDHGLPDYNTVRADFGLPRVQNFSQITSNAALAGALQSLYGTVNSIDAWVGILAEDNAPGSAIGPTGGAVITDQFMRLRDGDRFWYQNTPFDPADLAMIQSTRLADLIERNSGVTGLQHNIFVAANLPLATCVGDINDDRQTNILDFTILSAHFGQTVPSGFGGDLNLDGVVNIADFNMFVAGFGCDAR